MATSAAQEDGTIKELLAQNTAYKKIARKVGRNFDQTLKDRINDLREQDRQSKSQASLKKKFQEQNQPDPPTQQHNLNHIQAPKQKDDDDEYVALHEGTHKGEHVVLKAFCILGDRAVSHRAQNEKNALKQLTKRGYQHAPQFIVAFTKPFDGLVCRSESYVVMTKVPGMPLWRLRRDDEKLGDTREVEDAFAIAIADVHRREVDNGSHYDDNIMWDPEQRK
ncbi:hypothetical protein DOTSEDRAFT_24051 [Dothistroma septosporum NZE10]|uniref:Aminoglycoside phosphotransferase domain-containing protein n=1 Tax=Dothistroma septosporum (strain NZE10 / CBS 128990) TaxID=675120 RepID=N1PNH4_DOTSN|nr:hypothetical protein DOTSEDRAFT_24051 [Dothistroma septosporum NZE10]